MLRQVRLLKVCPFRSEKSADERRGSEVAACVIFMEQEMNRKARHSVVEGAGFAS